MKLGWYLLGVVRLSAILALLMTGALLALFVRWMPASLLLFITRCWYIGMIALIGIVPRYHGASIDKAALVVANHVSWVDILVIGGHRPCTFLAMQEVKHWPLIGWLASRVGTLFIQRGNGASNAISQVADVLTRGDPVVLFPEGRTSEGISVGRFHPRIFQAAVESGCPVQPVCLAFQDKGGAGGAGTRASFAQTTNFLHSLWITLCGPRIIVDVHIFETLDHGLDRQQLATQAKQLVSDHLEFTLGSSN